MSKKDDGVVFVSGLIVTDTLYSVEEYDSGCSRVHTDSVGVFVFVTGGKQSNDVAVHVYILNSGSYLEGSHSDVGEGVV